MQSDHGAVSLTGRRSNNEDAMLCLPRHGVFAVSDGMGGLDAGEVASQMAIESLAARVGELPQISSTRTDSDDSDNSDTDSNESDEE